MPPQHACPQAHTPPGYAHPASMHAPQAHMPPPPGMHPAVNRMTDMYKNLTIANIICGR